MEKDTALAIWGELEKVTYGWSSEDVGGTEPAYSVRLDAGVDDSREEARTYSLFVRIPHNHPEPAEAIMYVAELAREHEVALSLENAGVAIS